VYLIDELSIRYDVDLFIFILNLIEVMGLVQEAQKCPIRWLKLTTRISSINERNWNMQQFVGKLFRSRAIVGH